MLTSRRASSYFRLPLSLIGFTSGILAHGLCLGGGAGGALMSRFCEGDNGGTCVGLTILFSLFVDAVVVVESFVGISDFGESFCRSFFDDLLNGGRWLFEKFFWFNLNFCLSLWLYTVSHLSSLSSCRLTVAFSSSLFRLLFTSFDWVGDVLGEVDPVATKQSVAIS